MVQWCDQPRAALRRMRCKTRFNYKKKSKNRKKPVCGFDTKQAKRHAHCLNADHPFRVKQLFTPRHFVDGLCRSQWLVHPMLCGKVGSRAFLKNIVDTQFPVTITVALPSPGMNKTFDETLRNASGRVVQPSKSLLLSLSEVPFFLVPVIEKLARLRMNTLRIHCRFWNLRYLWEIVFFICSHLWY